ncbi:MAG: type II toxin-antitoxin system VapC family toxin [Acidobacteria bacterium]|nr:type II toxin-antitoxin system VapC family toxin [Acidobacteriota bacterium]
MKSSVLDSYAIIAYLLKEPGFEKVVALLERAAVEDAKVLICAPNWAEIRYILARRLGEEEWESLGTKLLALPIEIVDANRSLAEKAGKFKATKKMSLADCFAAALAQDRKSAVYTGDPEFREVDSEVEIAWLDKPK